MSTAYSSAKQQYIGNGVTTEWGFDFPIKKHSELKVYLKRSEMPQVLLEEGVDYSFVTENTIAFPIKTGEAKLQAADVLALQRESVFESEYNFSNQQRLEPEEVMHADDNLERQIQELKRDVSQAIRIQPTSNIDTDEYFVAVESIYENIDNITNVSGISSEIPTSEGVTSLNSFPKISDASRSLPLLPVAKTKLIIKLHFITTKNRCKGKNFSYFCTKYARIRCLQVNDITAKINPFI